MSNINYSNSFEPYVNKFNKITINQIEKNKLATVIANDINKKQIKLNRKLDDSEILAYKKIYMRIASEIIIAQLYRLHITIDYDKIFDKNYSSIKTLVPNSNINIICFDYGLFPMVYGKTYKTTIFVCMLNKNEFYVCGLGSKDIVNGFSTPDLIKSEYHKNNGRAAFFGFDRLKRLYGKLNELLINN